MAQHESNQNGHKPSSAGEVQSHSECAAYAGHSVCIDMWWAVVQHIWPHKNPCMLPCVRACVHACVRARAQMLACMHACRRAHPPEHPCMHARARAHTLMHSSSTYAQQHARAHKGMRRLGSLGMAAAATTTGAARCLRTHGRTRARACAHTSRAGRCARLWRRQLSLYQDHWVVLGTAPMAMG